MFGATSVTILDGESAGMTFEWAGERETLSARNFRTHIMGGGPRFSYDVESRTPYLDGAPMPLDAQSWDADLLHTSFQATLLLGGDLSYDWQGPAMAEFLERVAPFDRRGVGRPLIVVSADSDPAIGAELVAEYSDGLREAGWSGEIKTMVFGGDRTQWGAHLHRWLNGAAGVVFVADDASRLGPAVADRQFQRLISGALYSTPAVLTDRYMTAAMGDWYVANANPTGADYQELSSSSFLSGDVTVAAGLGLVEGAAFHPQLTDWQHWGRIYALTMAHPETIVFGISEMTAIVLARNADAQLAGERSAIALDGRAAMYATGNNGAFSAFNVMLDAFAPGDALAGIR